MACQGMTRMAGCAQTYSIISEFTTPHSLDTFYLWLRDSIPRMSEYACSSSSYRGLQDKHLCSGHIKRVQGLLAFVKTRKK